ncbi:O-antigen ligase family protein, partial [Candidatus Dependentiae bacterium]|nr:O-antigen ligase family protein [Candidatus Dependentiae bacterium]
MNKKFEASVDELNLKYLDISLMTCSGLFLLLTPLLFWYKTSNPYIIKDVFFQAISFLILILFLTRFVMSREFKFLRLPVMLPFMIYVIFTFVSITWAWGRYEAFYEFIYRMTGGFLVFLIFVNIINSEKKLHILFYIIILTGVLVSIYGIPQSFGVEILQPVKNWQSPFGTRVMSTLGNPNFAAGYLLGVLPLSLSLFLFSKRRTTFFRIPYKFIFGVTSVIILWCLIATQTRGALVSMLFGIVLFISIYFYIKVKSVKSEVPVNGLNSDQTSATKRVPFLIPISIVLVLVFILIFTTGGIGKRLATTKRQVLFSEGSIGQRYLMWNVGLKIVKDKPVLGTGIGMYRLLYPDYQGEFLMNENFIRQNTHARHPHNEFIENANDLGFFGLIVFLWLMFSIVIFGFKLLHKLFDDKIFPYLFGSLITVIIMLFHNLVSVVLRYTSPMLIFWSAISFIFIIYGLRVKSSLPDYKVSEIKGLFKNLFSFRKETYCTILGSVKMIFNRIAIVVIIFLIFFTLFWTRHNYRMLMASKNFSHGLGLVELTDKRAFPPNMPPEVIETDKFNITVEALKYFQKTAEFDPNYLNSYYRMGNCFIQLESYKTNVLKTHASFKKQGSGMQPQMRDLYKRTQASLAYLRKYIKDFNNSDEYFLIAAKYLKTGKKYKPSYAEINFNLGVCLSRLSRINKDIMKESIEHLKRAVEIEPINTGALKKLGEMYFKVGQQENGFKTFDRVFKVLEIEKRVDNKLLEYEILKLDKNKISFMQLNFRFKSLINNQRRILMNAEKIYKISKKGHGEEIITKYYLFFSTELKIFREYLLYRNEVFNKLLSNKEQYSISRKDEGVIRKILSIDFNDYFWATYREGKLHFNNGNLLEVEKVFNESIKFPKLKSDKEKCKYLINKLVDYNWELNNREKAFKLLDEEIRKGDVRFDIKKSFLFFRLGDLDNSSKILNANKALLKNLEAYRYVIDSYIDTKPEYIAEYFHFAS